jgi:7-cyano-7-deazaguanine synthase
MVPDGSYIEVPEGHYAQDNMKLTVVPNRNMIMLSIAAGVAINREANTIATAVHAGDHFVYPDCRPEFIIALSHAIITGNEGFHSFGHELDPVANADAIAQGYTHAAMPITSPYLYNTKAEIAYKALTLGTPLHMTWSCYKGGLNHCGRCGTCVERLEAIDDAITRKNAEKGSDDFRFMDSTVYDDNEYWKTVIQKG